MRSIYKYPIQSNNTRIQLPLEQILTVQLQNHLPCLWALINEDKPTITISIWILGTGWNLTEFKRDLTYISTVQDDDGFIWHFFYEIIEE